MQITFSSLPPPQGSSDSLISGVQTSNIDSAISQIAEILSQRNDMEPSG